MAKWVEIGSKHINTDTIRYFEWCEGILYIWFLHIPDPHLIGDTTKKLYIQLLMGVSV